LKIEKGKLSMICIPIMARNTSDAVSKMASTSNVCDLMEIRLDVMDVFDLKEIINSASKPIIITYRSRKEGGEGRAPYGERMDYLREAIRLGADFVDVEYTIPLEHRRSLFENRGRTQLILSKHFRNGTPSQETLSNLFIKMAATGTDLVKIVTRARVPQDNLTVLNLIPQAERMGVRIVTFCMGPLGRMSRVASPLLGGAFTFAALERGQESASGQMTVKETKTMLEVLTQ
jgi:3-dehydroquinate dehydratase-1